MKNLKELIEMIPVEVLFENKNGIEELLNSKIKTAVEEVKIEFVDKKGKNLMLTYNETRVITKPTAYMGRIRVFKAIPKEKGYGYKAGQVIIKEYNGATKDLAKALRFNTHLLC